MRSVIIKTQRAWHDSSDSAVRPEHQGEGILVTVCICALNYPYTVTLVV